MFDLNLISVITTIENFFKDYQTLVGVILTIIAMIYVDNQNKKRWQNDFIYKQQLEIILEFTTLYLEESNKLLACFKNIKRFIISLKDSKQTFCGLPLSNKGLNHFTNLIDNNETLITLLRKSKVYINDFDNLKELDWDFVNKFLNQTNIFYSRFHDKILNNHINMVPPNNVGIKENLYCLNKSMAYFIQDLKFIINPFILSYGYIFNEIEEGIDPNEILNQKIDYNVLDKANLLLDKCIAEIEKTQNIIKKWLKNK